MKRNVGESVMLDSNKTKIIVTLGPSTNTEQDLCRIKDKGVDFVRVNMSHSTLDDLRYFLTQILLPCQNGFF